MFVYKKVAYMNKESREQLIEELDRHQEETKEKQSGNIQRMFEIMNTHYNQLKEHVGLKDVLNESEDDHQSEQIFAKLRPTSPYKLSDLLSKKEIDAKKFIKHEKLKSGNRSRPVMITNTQDIKNAVLYNQPLPKTPKKQSSKKEYANL